MPGVTQQVQLLNNSTHKLFIKISAIKSGKASAAFNIEIDLTQSGSQSVLLPCLKHMSDSSLAILVALDSILGQLVLNIEDRHGKRYSLFLHIYYSTGEKYLIAINKDGTMDYATYIEDSVFFPISSKSFDATEQSSKFNQPVSR